MAKGQGSNIGGIIRPVMLPLPPGDKEQFIKWFREVFIPALQAAFMNHKHIPQAPNIESGELPSVGASTTELKLLDGAIVFVIDGGAGAQFKGLDASVPAWINLG